MDKTRVDKRIGVVVVTGFLGSGKTTLLNRVLADERMRNTLVIVNEAGELGIDQHLVHPLDDSLVLGETGGLRPVGALGPVAAVGAISGGFNHAMARTLRELYILALRRRIRPFDRVLIEACGLGDPCLLPSTLQRDPFLAEHYVLKGTIAVAHAQRIVGQLEHYLEATQQVAVADLLLLSHTQGLPPSPLQRAERALRYLQPTAALYHTDQASDLAGLLLGVAATTYRRGLAWRTGARLGGAGKRCGCSQVGAFALQLPKPLRRNAFLSSLARLQERHGEALLRVKGLVDFADDTRPCVVQGVHHQLYPLASLPAWPHHERQTRLVFITRDAGCTALQAEARERLREAVSNRAG